MRVYDGEATVGADIQEVVVEEGVAVTDDPVVLLKPVAGVQL